MSGVRMTIYARSTCYVIYVMFFSQSTPALSVSWTGPWRATLPTYIAPLWNLWQLEGPENQMLPSNAERRSFLETLLTIEMREALHELTGNNINKNLALK